MSHEDKRCEECGHGNRLNGAIVHASNCKQRGPELPAGSALNEVGQRANSTVPGPHHSAPSAIEPSLDEIKKVLQDACDRDWEDETLWQTANIAANAIYWRDREIAILKNRLSARSHVERITECPECKIRFDADWKEKDGSAPSSTEPTMSQFASKADYEAHLASVVPQTREPLRTNELHNALNGDDPTCYQQMLEHARTLEIELGVAMRLGAAALRVSKENHDKATALLSTVEPQGSPSVAPADSESGSAAGPAGSAPTVDGPLGGFATVGREAAELDLLLTQFQVVIEDIQDPEIDPDHGNRLGEEMLKLKREIIDRFAQSAKGTTNGLRLSDGGIDQPARAGELPPVEEVSAQVHAAWIASKLAQGVTSRKAEDGEELMVPYDQLTEKAKELDRGTVRAVYAAMASADRSGA